jgi:hypothetical protein
MKTWNCNTNEFIETPEKQVKFIKEIEEICKKYDLSISHEDRHGAFEIDKFSQDNIDWLKAAHVNWL